MKNTFDTTQNIHQGQIISLYQQQSLKVLSMDVASVCTMLKAEQESNPLLEVPPHITESAFGSLCTSLDVEEARFEIPSRDLPSLESMLREQIEPHKQKGELGEAISAILRCIDEKSGFLFQEAEEIIQNMSFGAAGRFEEALSLIRSLEPNGIGTKDMPDYLIWQLRVTNAITPIHEKIISLYLPALARGKLKEIAGALKITMRQVQETRDAIASLKPYPLYGQSGLSAAHIIPDAHIEIKNGELQISINDAWLHDIKINPVYKRYIEETEDESLRIYLREKLERANSLFRQIEQRNHTIYRICEIIVRVQRELILSGAALNKLNCNAIAQELQLALSTVSRCIKQKYISLPRGTVPLSALITSATQTKQPNEKRQLTEPMAAILELIKQENTSSPYSDDQLAAMLIRQGFDISRRTVAKYRCQLNIRNAYLRKK